MLCDHRVIYKVWGDLHSCCHCVPPNLQTAQHCVNIHRYRRLLRGVQMFSLASFALPTWQQYGEVFPPKTHGRENSTWRRRSHLFTQSFKSVFSYWMWSSHRGKQILPEAVIACFSAVRVSNDDLCVSRNQNSGSSSWTLTQSAQLQRWKWTSVYN